MLLEGAELTHTLHNADITTLGGAGFASQSTLFPSRLSLPRSRTSGLLLTFIPPPRSAHSASENGPGPGPVTRFVLALKTTEPARRPDGRRESVTVYEWAFDASEGAHELDLEGEKGEKAGRSVTRLARWDEFRPMFRGRPAEDAEPFDPARIYECVSLSLSFALESCERARRCGG